MRTNRDLLKEGARSSALWGRGNKGESRSSALWGKRGGRSAIAFASLAVALVLPVAGLASGASSNGNGNANGSRSAFVPDVLLTAAKANPDNQFKVIVQGDATKKSSDVSSDFQDTVATGSGKGKLNKSFRSISGIAATLSGKDIVRLA